MKKSDYQEMVEKGYCGDALNVEAFSEEDDVDFDMFQLLNSGETLTLHGFEMVDQGDEDRKKKEQEIRTHYGQLVLELGQKYRKPCNERQRKTQPKSHRSPGMSCECVLKVCRVVPMMQV